MKAIITITMLFFLAVPAMAEEKTAHENCKSLSSLARVIMELRQMGVPMHEVIEKAGDAPETVTRIAIMAYGEHMYHTESIKQQVINEFENKFFLECMRREVLK
jgi:penicillin V acylase-like amidase (Ntn superfamily)